MSVIKKFFPVKTNTQVHDLLSRVQSDFVHGKYGPSTRCMVIIQNPDDSKVNYETCGLHLVEAVGILEVAKAAIIKGN